MSGLKFHLQGLGLGGGPRLGPFLLGQAELRGKCALDDHGGTQVPWQGSVHAVTCLRLLFCRLLFTRTEQAASSCKRPHVTATASSPTHNLRGPGGWMRGRGRGQACGLHAATALRSGAQVAFVRAGAVLTGHLVYHRNRPFLDCGFSEDG